MATDVVPRATSGETFLLSECYATIQGESTFVGTPTIFVRLYTCNLRCVWCDSMYAVEGGEFKEVSVGDLTATVRKLAGPDDRGPRYGIRTVCWTGGGPLLHWPGGRSARSRQLPPLCPSQRDRGRRRTRHRPSTVTRRAGDGGAGRSPRVP